MFKFRWQQLSLFDFFSSSAPKSKPDFSSITDSHDAIRISVNPRMRQGWKLEWRRGDGAQLIVPPSVAKAPDVVRKSLLDWAQITLKRGRKDVSTKAKRRLLEDQVHAWIHEHNENDPVKKAQALRRAGKRLQRLEAQGRHHNLQTIFEKINAEYFEGKLEARITWSSRWGGLSTQSNRKDAEGKSYHLLSISRGYDHPSATPEIVGGVVYHECLHIAVPPEEREGRRTIHGREFRKREKEYRHYETWRKWHRDVLPKILRKRDPR